MISMKVYRRTHPEEAQASKPNFVEFLLSAPAWTDEMVEAVNQRSKEPGREIEF